MSGILQGVGKVFKPVLNVAKRVILPVAAVGAALVTGGMALGGTGLASGAAGLGGPLGNMLTTAVTRAGIGALAGSITGAGAKQGAMIGALSGAGESVLRGGLGSALGGGGQSMAMQEAMSTSNFGGGSGGLGAAMRGAGQIGSQFGAPARSPVGSTMVSELASPTNEGGFLKSVPGGSMIAGLGQGLSAYMQSKQESDMLRQRLDAQRQIQQDEIDYLTAKEDRQRAAYRVDPSVHHQATPRYRFDPATGQVVQG